MRALKLCAVFVFCFTFQLESLIAARTDAHSGFGLRTDAQVTAGEPERLAQIARCRESGDAHCMLDHMTAEERNAAFRNSAQGEARQLQPGETFAGFKVRIRVRLGTGTGQSLEVEHPGGKLSGIPVSGGAGGASSPIRGKCFVPHFTPTFARSQRYSNAPMYHPLFFMGRNGDQWGNVFAIHGTDAEDKLGNAASKGCIRVSKANANRIHGIVSSVGANNTVICID